MSSPTPGRRMRCMFIWKGRNSSPTAASVAGDLTKPGEMALARCRRGAFGGEGLGQCDHPALGGGVRGLAEGCDPADPGHGRGVDDGGVASLLKVSPGRLGGAANLRGSDWGTQMAMTTSPVVSVQPEAGRFDGFGGELGP